MQALLSASKKPEVVLRSTSRPKPRPRSLHTTTENLSYKKGSVDDAFSAVQRLDSLVGSPRAYDVSNSYSDTKSKNPNKPVPSRVTSVNNRDMTSTPVSNRGIEDSGLSPIPSSTSDHGRNPIRRDVPPPTFAPSSQSPLRRDVPPEIQPLQKRSQAGKELKTGSSPALSDEKSTEHPFASNDDSDKSTQWYEYGCV